MRIAISGFVLAAGMVEEGNPNSVTDAAVGAAALYAGTYGAYLNVLINLKDLKDRELAARLRTEADQLLEDAAAQNEAIRNKVLGLLS
jgi:glutamate formiminotransferase/formiminotetrahydrofolate cyclodeaminase